jgi:hypothetical protein
MGARGKEKWKEVGRGKQGRREREGLEAG